MLLEMFTRVSFDLYNFHIDQIHLNQPNTLQVAVGHPRVKAWAGVAFPESFLGPCFVPANAFHDLRYILV